MHQVLHVIPPHLKIQHYEDYSHYLHDVKLLRDLLGPDVRLAIGGPHHMQNYHGEKARHHVHPHNLSEEQITRRKARNLRRKESRARRKALEPGHKGGTYSEVVSRVTPEVAKHHPSVVSDHSSGTHVEHRTVASPVHSKLLSFNHKGRIFNLNLSHSYSSHYPEPAIVHAHPPHDAIDLVYKAKAHRQDKRRSGSVSSVHSRTSASGLSNGRFSPVREVAKPTGARPVKLRVSASPNVGKSYK